MTLFLVWTDLTRSSSGLFPFFINVLQLVFRQIIFISFVRRISNSFSSGTMPLAALSTLRVSCTLSFLFEPKVSTCLKQMVSVITLYFDTWIYSRFLAIVFHIRVHYGFLPLAKNGLKVGLASTRHTSSAIIRYKMSPRVVMFCLFIVGWCPNQLIGGSDPDYG